MQYFVIYSELCAQILWFINGGPSEVIVYIPSFGQQHSAYDTRRN